MCPVLDSHQRLLDHQLTDEQLHKMYPKTDSSVSYITHEVVFLVLEEQRTVKIVFASLLERGLL